MPAPAAWRPRTKFQNRVWLHAALFASTIATTTVAGASHYQAFRAEFLPSAIQLPLAAWLLRGFWYSVTVLSILGAHELGHYFACRYYDVDASLPYFLPFPPILPIGTLTGTFGAVIRIREPMQTKRVLFDVGVAGPIAGFLVAVPALVIGMSLSNVIRLPNPLPPSLELGEPLLFRAASWLFFGLVPDGYTVNMHPVAWAAWFGMLATALNLMPVGQLDGGHISYAVLGRRSTYVTFAMIGVAVGLTYFSPTWLFWALFMVVMLVFVGPRHPRTFDEHIPLDRTRLVVAACAVAMFILCFTPAPINEVGGALR